RTAATGPADSPGTTSRCDRSRETPAEQTEPQSRRSSAQMGEQLVGVDRVPRVVLSDSLRERRVKCPALLPLGQLRGLIKDEAPIAHVGFQREHGGSVPWWILSPSERTRCVARLAPDAAGDSLGRPTTWMKNGAPYSIPAGTELVLDGSGHVFKSAD